MNWTLGWVMMFSSSVIAVVGLITESFIAVHFALFMALISIKLDMRN